MSFDAIATLTNDSAFGSRVISCVTQQAETFKDAADPSFKALANACLRGETDKQAAFWRLVAAGPGISDQAGDPVDQFKITDAVILSAVQGGWPTVAGLFYTSEGVPL